MISLKRLLLELSEQEVDNILQKIREKQFRFIAQGDNGRVYEIDGEDKVFKITTDAQEFEVAKIIVGRKTEFTTFIPVYYIDNKKQMFVMSRASELSANDKNMIDLFVDGFKQYSRSEGGEVSVFDYLDAEGARDTDQELVSFLRALQQDINKMGIVDLDLDLDFKTDNVMRWSNRLVLVDW
jgi:hypothetical protein